MKSLTVDLSTAVKNLLTEFKNVSKQNNNFSVRLRGLLNTEKNRRGDILEDLLSLTHEVVDATSMFSVKVALIGSYLRDVLGDVKHEQ